MTIQELESKLRAGEKIYVKDFGHKKSTLQYYMWALRSLKKMDIKSSLKNNAVQYYYLSGMEAETPQRTNFDDYMYQMKATLEDGESIQLSSHSQSYEGKRFYNAIQRLRMSGMDIVSLGNGVFRLAQFVTTEEASRVPSLPITRDIHTDPVSTDNFDFAIQVKDKHVQFQYNSSRDLSGIIDMALDALLSLKKGYDND